MKNDFIQTIPFKNIDLKDSFFDSLKNDYLGFETWFNKKSQNNEKAVVVRDHKKIKAFMYLKEEFETNSTFIPNFDLKKRLKIGTFKIDSPGTIMGQRFIAFALRRFALSENEEAYITTFRKQIKLIKLLEFFGFEYYGINQSNGELIYVKKRSYKSEKNNLANFPFLNLRDANKFGWLAIKPKYHSKFFPEVKLKGEDVSIDDCAASNTVLKTYISFINDTKSLANGDLIYMYRTKKRSDIRPARYSSVITAVMRIMDSKMINEFSNFVDFKKFVGRGTVFDSNELNDYFAHKKNATVVKMAYLLPLIKRLTFGQLQDDYNIHPSYPGFVEFNKTDFLKIFKGAKMDETLIIN